MQSPHVSLVVKIPDWFWQCGDCWDRGIFWKWVNLGGPAHRAVAQTGLLEKLLGLGPSLSQPTLKVYICLDG